MPQIPANKEYNTFVKGLITEAGPLTFPENASIDEDNFVLNTKGYRQRRLGLDYENGFSFIEAGSSVANTDTWAISTTLWEDVNNDGNLIILVVQIGYYLIFFDASASPISGSQLNRGFKMRLGVDPKELMQFATISGKLVASSSTDSVYQFSYDVDLDKVTYSKHGLLVRDFWGVQDPNFDVFRSWSTGGEITDERAYNLFNRGWGTSDVETDRPKVIRSLHGYSRDTDIPLVNPLEVETTANTLLTSYVSTADMQGLDPNLYERPADGINPTDNNKFNGKYVKRALRGKAQAPLGANIIDVFYRGPSRAYAHEQYDILNNYREDVAAWDTTSVDGNTTKGQHLSLVSGVSPVALVKSDITPNTEVISLPVDTSTPRVSCVAAFAGRIFYGGFTSKVEGGDNKSPNLATHVLFSQVVTGDDKIGKCYQEGDPTSISDFDLVDSDGGYIVIQGVATILKLVPVGSSLLVFATNGVWEIGGSDVIFSATGYTVNKITDVGVLGADSIAVTNRGVFYWANNGIYALAKEEISAQYSAVNISIGTVQSLFLSIPNTAKRYCRGIYTSSDNSICWLYNDNADYDGVITRQKYNRQLNLNLDLNAFYTYSFAEDSNDAQYPYVCSMLNSPDFISTSREEQLIDDNDELIVDGGVAVVVSERVITRTDTKNMYTLIKKDPLLAQDDFTFGLLNNSTFVDWESDASTEKDVPAYLITGYELLGDTQRQKQVGYITTHMQRTETGFDINLDSVNPSSCLMETRWGFADTAASNKFSSPVQVYRYRRDFVPAGTGDTFDYGFPIITTKNKIRGRGRALSIKFSTEAGKDCILYGWGVLGYGNQNV